MHDEPLTDREMAELDADAAYEEERREHATEHLMDSVPRSVELRQDAEADRGERLAALHKAAMLKPVNGFGSARRIRDDVDGVEVTFIDMMDEMEKVVCRISDATLFGGREAIGQYIAALLNAYARGDIIVRGEKSPEVSTCCHEYDALVKTARVVARMYGDLLIQGNEGSDFLDAIAALEATDE